MFVVSQPASQRVPGFTTPSNRISKMVIRLFSCPVFVLFVYVFFLFFHLNKHGDRSASKVKGLENAALDELDLAAWHSSKDR